MGQHKKEMGELHQDIAERMIPVPPNVAVSKTPVVENVINNNVPQTLQMSSSLGQMPKIEPNSQQSFREQKHKIHIPEPPKSKEVHVPEIVRGPLFIKQSKFYSALDELSSMKELISSIQDEVYGLNETLRSDVQLIEHLDHLLEEMGQSNNNVRGLVIPK